MSVFDKIKEVFKRLFSKENIQNKIGVNIAVSDKMATAIDKWVRCYKNNPWWRYVDGKDKVKTLNLPAIIASELARLVTTELETSVSNAELDPDYQRVIADLRQCCEIGCATGGLAFKPFIENGRVSVDYVDAESFYPTDFDSNGEITGTVFTDRLVKGKTIYTKLEKHKLEGTRYTIENYAFKNESDDPDVSIDIGRQIALTEVEEWQQLDERFVVDHIQAPLFAYFKMPGTNTIDKTCPLGISCFAKALELIEQADRQYDRLLWEYKGSELAIDLPADWFEFDEVRQKWKVPEGQERLFRLHDMDDGDKSYNVFAPAIRDASLINGLNNLLKRIEFNCGLSYGTISDPENIDKTATEIISSKQRLYSTVKDIQLALEDALQQLVYAMSVWKSIAGPTIPSGAEATFNWDDSVIIDKQAELAAMQQDVASGILKPELYLAKKYGVTESEALKMMPDTEETIDGGIPVSDPNKGGATDLPPNDPKEIKAAEEIAGKTLNGAQTQSLLGIIGQYTKGELTIGQAVNLISVAIGISKEEAKKIIEGAD